MLTSNWPQFKMFNPRKRFEVSIDLNITPTTTHTKIKRAARKGTK